MIYLESKKIQVESVKDGIKLTNENTDYLIIGWKYNLISRLYNIL